MKLVLHDCVERPHVCACDGKGKIVISPAMHEKWLSMDDIQSHVWSTHLNFG